MEERLVEEESLFLTENNILNALKCNCAFKKMDITDDEKNIIINTLKMKCTSFSADDRLAYILRAYPLCMVSVLCYEKQWTIEDIIEVYNDIIGIDLESDNIKILDENVRGIINRLSPDPKSDVRIFEHNLNKYLKAGITSKNIEALLESKQSRDYHNWPRLKKRIIREFNKTKYICDIRINDDEYLLLKEYLKTLVKSVPCEIQDEIFATAIVHVATHCYKGGNLWGTFFSELELKPSQTIQSNIGEEFDRILEEHGKIIIGRGKHFQNILLHCFVSNNYADAYFEFLYKFYSLDLDRDITRLDREMMNELMNSICSEDKTGRSYMLVQHISLAMAANRRGAKIRIRNTLKLLDKFFWDNKYEIVTDHRIYNLLQEWIRKSEMVNADYEEYKSGRKRGAKHFSYPYLHYDESWDSFSLILPSQTIKRISGGAYWNISGGSKHYYEAELVESVTGYKVMNSSVNIEFGCCLSDYRIELVTETGEIIKTFVIKNTDGIRFFDEFGDPVNSQTLKVGQLLSVSNADSIIQSSGLYDHRIRDSILISYFLVEYEDIIKMPNEKAVIVGQKDVQTGITAKGSVENAICTCGGIDYKLYSHIPFMIIRLKSDKINGTLVTVNGSRYHMSDFNAIQFDVEDLSNDVGIFMNLETVISDKKGIYTIGVDIPGGISKEWHFVYISGFNATFEDSPYIFEPRGTVTFPADFSINSIEETCIKESDSNSYKFEIETVGRLLNFSVLISGKTIDIALPVPAVFTDLNNNDNWTSVRPPLIWHDDYPNVITISVPYHKVILYMENNLSDDDNDIREVEYRRNQGDHYIKCDISRFKSYMNFKENFTYLKMKFSDIDTELLGIVNHGILISASIIGDFDHGKIMVDANLIGKGEYYIDIFYGSELIAEKILLDSEGKADVPSEIWNGSYEVIIYESECNGSGFGEEDYYQIGKVQQPLLNPYDMTGRSFKIMQIEKKDKPDVNYPIGFYYYVEQLRKTKDNNRYRGTMVVEKADGSPFAKTDTIVYFPDIKRPNYAWISCQTS